MMFQRSVFLRQKSYPEPAEASQCLLERTRKVSTYPGIGVLHITLCVFVLGNFLSGTAVAQGDIRFRADFESGSVQGKNSNHDGFRIMTLPINQVGTTVFSSASGCCGPSAPLDTRVVSSRKPPNTGLGAATETVLPRNGQFFLESSIHYNKNYTAWNGNAGQDKTRSAIYITGHEFDFDQESFIGFSIYLPSNLEIEGGVARRMSVYGAFSTTTATLIDIALSPPEVGRTKWGVIWYTSDTSIFETGKRSADLGLISADRGKWTDFVIRYRFNPFKTRTNASTISGGKNQFYDGNKGILQIWKAIGDVDQNGNREMKLMVNLVNEPVGLVPRADVLPRHTFKIYKGAWKRQSTTISGPIWMGFDEIRFGTVAENNTGFSDVYPGGQACTVNCNGSSPNPPINLQISQ